MSLFVIIVIKYQKQEHLQVTPRRAASTFQLLLAVDDEFSLLELFPLSEASPTAGNRMTISL